MTAGTLGVASGREVFSSGLFHQGKSFAARGRSYNNHVLGVILGSGVRLSPNRRSHSMPPRSLQEYSTMSFLARSGPLAALLLASAFSASSGAHAATSDPLRLTLEQSRDSKQGVTLIVGGHDVALMVIQITSDYVIGKNQQHDRIVVRIDRIDAALK
jgi:hypothetical protein